MKILIIDDSKVLREKLAMIISEIPGVEKIYFAENGVSGLEQLKKIKPDMLILDIMMPELNGIDFLKTVQPEIADFTIAVFSHYYNEQYRKACRKYGANNFFAKPQELLKLVDFITRTAGNLLSGNN